MRAAQAVMMAVLLAVLAGCSGDDPRVGPDRSGDTTPPTTPPPTPPTTPPPTTAPVPTTAPLPAAPWAAPKLGADQVPAVLLQEWRAAGSPADCAALAPSDLGTAANGTPRGAEFGDRAWAVAWDVPGAPGRQASGQPCPSCGRGAVVVAGTSLDASGSVPGALPGARRWRDGSVAQYGLEGGAGPAYLAQLEVSGQRCLYNVSSFLGEAHLLRLLDSLRFVQGAP